MNCALIFGVGLIIVVFSTAALMIFGLRVPFVNPNDACDVTKQNPKLCKKYGHVKWGPRRGDGKVICGRCRQILRPGRYDHMTPEQQAKRYLERELARGRVSETTSASAPGGRVLPVSDSLTCSQL